jgi:hypothetical protein
MVVLYANGGHGSEMNGIMIQSQKCIKYDKNSFRFDEHLSKGEREFFSLIKHKQGVSSNNSFSQSNPDVTLKILDAF